MEEVTTAGAGTQGTGSNEPEKTFTQAQLDAIVTDRLSRQKAKYADYDELKAKAAEFDKQREAGKSELQKAQEKIQELTAEKEKAKKDRELKELRAKVSKATGVPEELIGGDTEEEMTAKAKAVAAWAKPNQIPGTGHSGPGFVKTGDMKVDPELLELRNEIFGQHS